MIENSRNETSEEIENEDTYHPFKQTIRRFSVRQLLMITVLIGIVCSACTNSPPEVASGTESGIFRAAYIVPVAIYSVLLFCWVVAWFFFCISFERRTEKYLYQLKYIKNIPKRRFLLLAVISSFVGVANLVSASLLLLALADFARPDWSLLGGLLCLVYAFLTGFWFLTDGPLLLLAQSGTVDSDAPPDAADEKTVEPVADKSQSSYAKS